jgi:perosamine synthetase
LKNQGRAKDNQWLDHKTLGYNYRLDEMSCALGVSQLEKLYFMVRERRKIAYWYNKFLKPYGNLIQTPVTAGYNTHTWFVYVVKIKNAKIDRDRIIEQLKQEGISSKSYLPSIHLFDFYKKKFNYKPGNFPVSEGVSRSSLALPLYIGLKEKDVNYIANKLINILKKYER